MSGKTTLCRKFYTVFVRKSEERRTARQKAEGWPSTVMKRWTVPGRTMYSTGTPAFMSLSVKSAPWQRRMSRSAATSNVGGKFGQSFRVSLQG